MRGDIWLRAPSRKTFAGKIFPGILIFTLFCKGHWWSHADAYRVISEGITVPHEAFQSI